MARGKQNRVQKQISEIKKWLKMSELERFRFKYSYTVLGENYTKNLLKSLEKINKERQKYKRKYGRDRGY